jgi:DNA-binding response OmpR family regulator/anti-sigma regulatory factor (Ser/Thr protein kinase)
LFGSRDFNIGSRQSVSGTARGGQAGKVVTANILIVDDSLTVRMDLAEAFGKAGFRPLPCETLAEARRILRDDVVSLAIIDVVLPDGDGVDLLRELRSGATSEIPVLMLSTESEVRDRIRGLQTGANDYVGKPYDTGYVIARARQLLRGQSRPGDEKTVVLVEDSLTARAEIATALNRAGLHVLTAGSGEEGLRILADVRPVALIVDGMLPGMDGGAVIRRVRLDAALRSLPCLLLTGAAAVSEELKALDSGADAFVHKGEDPEIMLAKLNALLRSASDSKLDAETTSLLGPKQILAVDDNDAYREALANALREEGYDVISARSGEEAIELLAVQAVDCVLLDMSLPGIDGMETCRRLKSSPLRDIPLVIVSTVEDKKAMLEGLSLGADDYVEKSATFEILKARVRAQLRRRQVEDETRRVREQLLQGEIEASEARAARALAETRAQLVEQLERKNQDLQEAYQALQATQAQLVQSAKMASLGQLVAGVAHEINNPLSFALSHLNTVRKSLNKVGAQLPAADENWQRALNRLSEIDTGLERIRDLVVKLRTFSRLDEGERKLASMRECVESVLTILNHRLKENVRVETSFSEVDLVECYPGPLNQAIMNLVTNAIDALGEDGGSIRIETHVQDDEFSIVVEDDGAGIAPAIRERVLEPFFTTKAVGHGTGLGLSITYSIVLKHGGSLTLSDRPQGGTRAVIRIPKQLAVKEGEHAQ